MRKIDLSKVEEANTGAFKRPVGGFECAIRSVKDHPEEQFLEISFDVITGEFKNYFQQTEKQIGYNLGTFRQYYAEKSLPFFKGFVTSVLKSNPNFKWDYEDESKLVNKKLGIVIGEREYLNKTGAKKTGLYVASVHSVEAIKNGDFNTPELKKLDESKTVFTKNQDTFQDPFADSAEPENTNDSPFDTSDNPFA